MKSYFSQTLLIRKHRLQSYALLGCSSATTKEVAWKHAVGEHPEAPPPLDPKPRSSNPDSGQPILWGTLLFCLLRPNQMTAVAAFEYSCRKGWPFPGAFLGWIFLVKATLTVVPHHQADVAICAASPVQPEAFLRSVLMAHVITAIVKIH